MKLRLAFGKFAIYFTNTYMYFHRAQKCPWLSSSFTFLSHPYLVNAGLTILEASHSASEGAGKLSEVHRTPLGAYPL